MNIEKLKQTINNEDILKEIGFEVSYSDGNTIRGACPIHGGNNQSSFIFNKETLLWYCHTGCKRGGDIISLVMATMKLDFISTIKFICNKQGISLEELHIEVSEQKKYKSMAKFIEEVTHTSYELKPYTISAVNITEVKRYKHYGENICSSFGIMHAEQVHLNEEKTVTNKLVFPIIQNNETVGYSLRAVGKDDTIKWMHIPKGIKTSNLLYNYDVAKINDGNVILVEGTGDVISVVHAGYSSVVGVFGSVLSKGQIEALMAICTELTFMFDGDDAGRKGMNKSIEMVKNIFDCYICNLKDGQDPGDMNDEEIKAVLENRKKVN